MRGVPILAACLLCAGCTPTARLAPAQQPPSAALSPSWAQPARDVLIYHCGTCHRSDLPTAIPGALAVFDLTDDHWYQGLRAEQLPGVLRRVQAKEDLDPVDLATIEAFVASAESK